jgi:hypothetical protein
MRMLRPVLLVFELAWMVNVKLAISFLMDWSLSITIVSIWANVLFIRSVIVWTIVSIIVLLASPPIESPLVFRSTSVPVAWSPVCVGVCVVMCTPWGSPLNVWTVSDWTYRS